MDFTIEYLNLAMPKIYRKITKVEQFTHNCYFTNQFKHNMHGESTVKLNSRYDNIIRNTPRKIKEKYPNSKRNTT